MQNKTKQTTTCWRGFGDETPIGRWIRNNNSLPSRGAQKAFAVTNTDLTVHGYMTCVDGIGTREVQSILRVEFKSHGKLPDSWQLDTLFKEHEGINRRPRGYLVKNAVVINHGICLCVCPGATPDDADCVLWGVFARYGAVQWSKITVEQLNGILAFDLHPKTLLRNYLRRHHKKTAILKVETTALGFEIERQIVSQS